MKIYRINKNIKKAELPQPTNPTNPTNPTYTVRSMLQDLSKWDEFLKNINTNENI